MGAHLERPPSRPLLPLPLWQVANFEAAYNGNRAPFPIFVHTDWLRTGQRIRGLQLFAGGCTVQARCGAACCMVRWRAQPNCLPSRAPRHPSCHPTRPTRAAEYALKKKDVYFVTMRQLLAWMANPIPADQITAENLGCGNAGGTGAEQREGQGSGRAVMWLWCRFSWPCLCLCVCLCLCHGCSLLFPVQGPRPRRR